MREYYEILGINENATEEELKTAYRNLAKKYHPDNFTDDAAKEMAEEKMRKINEAYDYVIAQIRRRDPSSNVNCNFDDVRQLINSNRIEEALEILDGVTPQSRNAEWYYLNGVVQQKRGWFKNAYTSFSNACSMDPNNPEYRTAFENIQRQRTSNGYGGSYSDFGDDCTCCDMCACALCANMCCNCMRCI
jgi:molecular chaperone DnaJ